jgi:hypothetical protein
LRELELAVKNSGNTDPLIAARPRLQQLCAFYDHLVDAQKGYQKDPAKREEGEKAIKEWQTPVKHLLDLVSGSSGA